MAVRSSTIRDVASRAGVSVGTASKAFNHKGRLADATRHRILKAAADIHYTPNALIRSLQRGRTHSIGVFTWEVKANPAQSITMTLLRGLTKGIEEIGCDTLLYSHFPERTPRAAGTVFLDGRVDGLILGPTGVSTGELAGLVEAKLPTIVLYCREVPTPMGFVDVDNTAGVTEAVRHLLHLGHRRIAFYAPHLSFNYAERLAAYAAALQEAGITPDPALIFYPGNNPDGGSGEAFVPSAETACATALSLPDPATAVIAGDDAVAFQWLNALSTWGVRVPHEFSVVGFDDAWDAATLPGLTTIRQPCEEVGRAAARFVETLIGGGPVETCRTVLPVHFIARGTTASAPAQKSKAALLPKPKPLSSISTPLSLLR